MQEEVESRTVTLAINTAKLTGRVLKAAICKYLAYRKEKKREGPVKSRLRCVPSRKRVSSLPVLPTAINHRRRTSTR